MTYFVILIKFHEDNKGINVTRTVWKFSICDLDVQEKNVLEDLPWRLMMNWEEWLKQIWNTQFMKC